MCAQSNSPEERQKVKVLRAGTSRAPGQCSDAPAQAGRIRLFALLRSWLFNQWVEYAGLFAYSRQNVNELTPTGIYERPWSFS